MSDPTYYVVDRPRSLSAGLVMSRIPVPDPATTEETAVARCVFPDGIAKWGEDEAVFTQPSLAVTIEALAAWGFGAQTPAGLLPWMPTALKRYETARIG